MGSGGHPLRACPVCLGFTDQEPTLAEVYRRASDVVVAHADADADNCTIDRVIKGDAKLVGQAVALRVALGTSGSVVLSREKGDVDWKAHGATGLHLQLFFRFVEALPLAKPATDDEWLQRLGHWRRFLGHADSRIARSAWSEWAGAPYRVIRQARFEPNRLRSWLADPSQGYAKPMWIVLLGVSGTEKDTRWVQKQLETVWSKNESPLIPALLTARIEQEGTVGIKWLEEHYIRDRDRTLAEIRGATTALGVHGTANENLRPRILAACRTLLKDRRPLSGLVARDLAKWKDWSATKHYQTLLASGEPVLPETRRGIIDYLESSERFSTSKSGKH